MHKHVSSYMLHQRLPEEVSACIQSNHQYRVADILAALLEDEEERMVWCRDAHLACRMLLPFGCCHAEAEHIDVESVGSALASAVNHEHRNYL
jgi:hypothetical protein